MGHSAGGAASQSESDLYSAQFVNNSFDSVLPDTTVIRRRVRKRNFEITCHQLAEFIDRRRIQIVGIQDPHESQFLSPFRFPGDDRSQQFDQVVGIAGFQAEQDFISQFSPCEQAIQIRIGCDFQEDSFARTPFRDLSPRHIVIDPLTVFDKHQLRDVVPRLPRRVHCQQARLFTQLLESINQLQCQWLARRRIVYDQNRFWLAMDPVDTERLL